MSLFVCAFEVTLLPPFSVCRIELYILRGILPANLAFFQTVLFKFNVAGAVGVLAVHLAVVTFDHCDEDDSRCSQPRARECMLHVRVYLVVVMA